VGTRLWARMFICVAKSASWLCSLQVVIITLLCPYYLNGNQIYHVFKASSKAGQSIYQLLFRTHNSKFLISYYPTLHQQKTSHDSRNTLNLYRRLGPG